MVIIQTNIFYFELLVDINFIFQRHRSIERNISFIIFSLIFDSEFYLIKNEIVNEEMFIK